MHTILIGLGFGDEGKGSLTDALARGKKRGSGAVVRFNGGPQAAHHVVTPKGESHCFSQFGAGTLAGLPTFLSRYMVVDPLALWKEANALRRLGVARPLSMVTIDEACVVATPFHKLVNRIQEAARGEERHGSCGMGVGQALLDSLKPGVPSLRVGELLDAKKLSKKLKLLQLVKLDQAEQLADARPGHPAIASFLAELGRRDFVKKLSEEYQAILRDVGNIDDGSALKGFLASGEGSAILEGAQGVLLDAERGFWPHVTPSCTTFQNGLCLLAEAGAKKARRLGILRAYSTRHGAGPFVAQDDELSRRLTEPHNVENPWQGPMRAGWLDLVSARYALDVAGGVDAIALTCLDRLSGFERLRLCTAWRYCGQDEPILDNLFELSHTKEGLLIHRIKSPPEVSREHQTALTQKLSECRPVFIELPGWRQVFVKGTPSFGLTREVRDFLDVLESSQGLGSPLEVISAGPSAKEKFFRESYSENRASATSAG